MADGARRPETLVVGLGNPLLGDDGVGWLIVDELERRLSTARPDGAAVEVDRLSVGGLRLMERLLGYRRAVIVDATSSGEEPAGSVRIRPLAELPDVSAGHLGSAHDASLQTALGAARALGASLPEDVLVLTVEAACVRTFTQDLTPEVARAVAPAVDRLLQVCLADGDA